jgi:hypothetical protein
MHTVFPKEIDMSFSFLRGSAVLSIAVILVGISACKTNNVDASSGGPTADMSGPPTFNERFQARNPRLCRTVTTPPTPEEAQALVQCAWESHSTTGGMNPSLALVTDLQVRMSSPRPFKMELNNPVDVDTSGKVYDLRGQGTSWTCSPVGGVYTAGQNCARYEADPRGVGECWHTTFGDWKCEMTVGGPIYSNHLKGPTTY